MGQLISTEAAVAVNPTESGEEPTVQIWLLGGLRCVVDGRPLELPVASKRLLAFIALHRPSDVERSLVAGELWPERCEERAMANLRSALWRLRNNAPDLIEASPSTIALADDAWIDTEHLLASLLGTQDGHTIRVDEMMSPLLPGWYDEWVVHEREILRQRSFHCVEAASRTLLDLGRFGQALDLALHAVASEPLRESPHRLAIEAHIAEGNICEARRHYMSYQAMISAEMGVAPSRELRSMVESAAVG